MTDIRHAAETLQRLRSIQLELAARIANPDDWTEDCVTDCKIAVSLIDKTIDAIWTIFQP
jgi:hypothetical protein